MGDALERILIAVDGSEPSLEAALYTAELLRPGNAEIKLLHVFLKVPDAFWELERDPDWAPKVRLVRGWEAEQRQKALGFLEAAQLAFVGEGFSADRVSLELVDPVESVVGSIKAVAGEGYHVVVMGRRGVGGREVGDGLGSVASQVLETLSGCGLWMVDGRPDPHRILIGLAASEASLAAVDHAARMLRSSECFITLLHVVRGISIPRDVMKDSFPVEYRQRLLEEAENAMKPTFQAARGKLLDAGVTPERLSSRLRTGVSSRAGAIVEEARQGGFGTIILGRPGFSRGDEHNVGRVGRQICQMVRNRAVWIVG
ncbi:MAG: universal stress protein [Syntrophobacteraceae bacterium]